METSTTNYDFKKMFEIEKKLLISLGFYPYPGKHFMRGQKFKIFLWYTCIFALNTSIMLLLYFKPIADFIDSSALPIANFTFQFKMIHFIFNHNLIIDVEEILERPIFCKVPKAILEKIENRVKVTKLVARCYRYTIASYLIAVVVMIAFERRERQLPFKSWIPYDTHGTFSYYATSIFEISCVIISSHSNASMDVLGYSFLTITTCQFDVIMYNLEEIDYNMPITTIEKNLKNIVRHHVEILRLFGIVNKIYSNIVLIQCLGSVLVICMVGIQTLFVPFGSLKFCMVLIFAWCMLLEVAFYCWNGQNILIKSSEIGNACYGTNWYDSDLRIRKLLFIIMERSKIPVSFTVGGFFTMSLATLTKILKSSYSYFAVLQQIYKKS